MARTHYFPDDQVHFTWDAGNEPVLTVESGDTVVVHTRDVSDNQITPESTTADLDRLDWDRVYPLAGPIAVAGAEPGDTLAVEVLDLHTEGWGWTAILPGLGLLAEDFADAYLRVFDISAGDFARLESAAIPLDPFLGTMGVCPAGAKEQPVMPPGVFGGNMDTRQLNQGTTLFLPVQVPGALFSTGDAHGVQGDGEVCVTAIETGLIGTFELIVRDDMHLEWPRAETPTHVMTMAFDPDLDDCVVIALRDMIDLIVARTGLAKAEAYALCSLAADLRITQVVNGNKGVHVMLDKRYLVGRA
jgi:acetamidase/formamidase